MERRGLLAVEHNVARLDGVHKVVLVNRFGEEVDRHDGCFNDGFGGKHTDVHFAVLDTGFGCNIGLVSPLTGIGEGDEEGFLFELLTCFGNDTVGFRAVGDKVFHHVREVALEAACAGGGETVSYECIKARAAGRDEESVVRQSVVGGYDFGVIDHFDGALGAEGNTDMPRKAVAAAHRYNAEGSLGVAQSACYLIERTVATDCYHGMEAHLGILVRQFAGMTGVLGELNVRQPLIAVKGIGNEFGQTFLILRPADGVDNECDVLH